MRKLLWVLLATALLVHGTVSALAQAPAAGGLKPVLTLAFRGYDELKQDVAFIGEAGGNPQLADMLEMMLSQGPTGEVFAAIDKSRPWGIVVRTDGQQFPILAFLPAASPDALLKALEPQVGPAQKQGNLSVIQAGNQQVFVGQKGTWTIVGSTADTVNSAPTDPVAALGGLEEGADLAVRLVFKNVPPQYRQMLMALPQMAQMGMQPNPGESQEQFQMRMKLMQQSITRFSSMLNELDTLELGIDIDRQARVAAIQYQMTALPNTNTAKQFAAGGELKSQFAGFFQPDAALSAAAVARLTDDDKQQAKAQIATARVKATADIDKQKNLSAADRQIARQMLEGLLDVVAATVEQGRVDVGASLKLAGESPTLVAGAAVAETAKVEELVKQAAAQIKKEAPQLTVALNAAEHEGVKFHRFSLPTQDMEKDAPKLRAVLGEQIDVLVGVGKQNVYLAAGQGGLEAVKQSIDASVKPAANAPPTRAVLAAGQIAQFAARVSDGEAQQSAEKIAGILTKTPGKDRVTMTAALIPQGQKMRIEIQEGILALLGALPTLSQGQ